MRHRSCEHSILNGHRPDGVDAHEPRRDPGGDRTADIDPLGDRHAVAGPRARARDCAAFPGARARPAALPRPGRCCQRRGSAYRRGRLSLVPLASLGASGRREPRHRTGRGPYRGAALDRVREALRLGSHRGDPRRLHPAPSRRTASRGVGRPRSSHARRRVLGQTVHRTAPLLPRAVLQLPRRDGKRGPGPDDGRLSGHGERAAVLLQHRLYVGAPARALLRLRDLCDLFRRHATHGAPPPLLLRDDRLSVDTPRLCPVHGRDAPWLPLGRDRVAGRIVVVVGQGKSIDHDVAALHGRTAWSPLPEAHGDVALGRRAFDPLVRGARTHLPGHVRRTRRIQLHVVEEISR